MDIAPQGPAQDSSRRAVALLATLAVGVLTVLYFFQTRDPMMLVFGIIAASLVWVVASGRAGWGSAAGVPPAQQIRVKCRSCGGLNPEDAKYCNACGKSL